MKIREHFSQAGRKLALEKLDWDKICKQWENVLDMANTEQNKPYPKINYPKPIKLEDMLEKEKKDRILYVMPGTFGDVFLSTAVVNSLKKKYPNKDIYFSTSPQFAPILEGNPDIFKVLPFDSIFMNYVLMNQLFEITYHPNIETQTHGNWVKNGHGKHLLKVYSDYCDVTPSDKRINLSYVKDLPQEFIVIQAKTGQSQKDYPEMNKISSSVRNIKIIQIGSDKDPKLLGADHTYLGAPIGVSAFIISKAKLFIGGDSIGAHLAGFFNTPMLQIFGGTDSNLVDPRYNNNYTSKYVAMVPTNRLGCEYPCHATECNKIKNGSCSSTISPNNILHTLNSTFNIDIEIKDPKISGYTTTFNPKDRYPWKEAIISMLGFCDEVIVVDGKSNDGTLEELQEWKKIEPKLKVYKRRYMLDEPAMDGMQKAYARALCSNEFCWQQDIDEIVHEDDYIKIKELVKTFPSYVNVYHLPVIDLYGNEKLVKADTGLFKWRLTRNLPNITHGIHKQARKMNKNGQVFADKKISDGCEYIYSDSFEIVREQSSIPQHNQNLLQSQNNNPSLYIENMKEIFNTNPSVWHFSWADLERRIKVNLDFWNAQWARLDTGDPQAEQNPMFPGKKSTEITPEDIKKRAIELFTVKEDGNPVSVFEYTGKKPPKVIENWLRKSFLQGNSDYLK